LELQLVAQLFATLGAGWAIAIDGVSFLAAGAIVFSLRKYTPVAKPSSESTINELKNGWREFTSHKWIVAIVAASYCVVARTFRLFNYWTISCK
jgi:hypothetical protein